MGLEKVKANGLFLIGDPHIASTPPGQRLGDFAADVLDKLEACFERAAELDMIPLILDMIGLFGKYKPFVLVGNHDKYQARFTPDVSMAVLDAAGVINLISEHGPALELETPQGLVLVGASPDSTPIPKEFDREDGKYIKVVWVTHHNIS
ncbi:metallophosphoesterase, partial [Aduncisulcus paluster]